MVSLTAVGLSLSLSVDHQMAVGIKDYGMGNLENVNFL